MATTTKVVSEGAVAIASSILPPVDGEAFHGIDYNTYERAIEARHAELNRIAPIIDSELRELIASCRVTLDQIDYTSGACKMNEPIGGCLDRSTILSLRAALARFTA